MPRAFQQTSAAHAQPGQTLAALAAPMAGQGNALAVQVLQELAQLGARAELVESLSMCLPLAKQAGFERLMREDAPAALAALTAPPLAGTPAQEVAACAVDWEDSSPQPHYHAFVRRFTQDRHRPPSAYESWRAATAYARALESAP